jgi:acetyl esterase/lipase
MSFTTAQKAALANVKTLSGYVATLSAHPEKRTALVADLRTLARDATTAADLIDTTPAPAPTPTPTPTPVPVPTLPLIGATPTHVSAVPTLNSDNWLYQMGGASVTPNGFTAMARWPIANKTPLTGPLPCFVLVHGGPLKLGDYDNLGSVVAEPLARYLGVISLAIDYATLPDDGAGWPQSGQQIADAIAWMRANASDYGGDPARVYVLAHSYGGHYGFPATEQLASVAGYIGIDTVAPMSTATIKGELPVLLVEGSLDLTGQTATGQAQLAAILANAGVRGFYIVADGADHTSTLITKSVLDAIAAFLGGTA